MKSIYLIGSLNNPRIPLIGNRLREEGFDTFEDWTSPGRAADLCWMKYEKIRGRTYKEALNGYHARHVCAFDKFHLDRCDIGILVMKAGRSGHLELGYMIGQAKPGYILFDKEPCRYDIMYGLCTGVYFSLDELVTEIKKPRDFSTSRLI